MSDDITPSAPWQRDVDIRREERELVLVYIGAASCGPCNDPEFKAVLAEFKRTIAEVARAERRKLRTIGVSDDWDVDAGLEFLRGCGPWDEVVAGNNMYNSAMIEHIWNFPNAQAAMPQIIVYERSFIFFDQRMIPGPRNYLIRLVSKFEVDDWLQAWQQLEQQ